MAQGESIKSNRAFVTVTKGGVDKVCARLLSLYHHNCAYKAEEDELPVLYNEYCYTWGNPEQKKLEEVLPVAAQLNCKYFVIDDGWFVNDYGEGKSAIGGWDVSLEKFPDGLKSFVEKAENFGIKTGIWYEFEGVSQSAPLYRAHPDWLLTYNGQIINNGGRAFLDFRKREVTQYLREKVIKNIRDNRIGYIKVDYNENVGLGADGDESYGEALRQHIIAVSEFYKEIKRTFPNLVLEICSSGGMRHEPAFLQLADMVSFSDAHENAGGVNIAFNLHRFIPARKLQIWATVRDDYTIDDIAFTVAKAMLGRLCFSGNLASKSQEVIAFLKKAVEFYDRIKHIIISGETVKIEDEKIKTYFKPQGSTYLIRDAEDGSQRLIYAFAICRPSSRFVISAEGYKPIKAFNAPDDLTLFDGNITFTSKNCELWGTVILLEK